MLGSESKWAQYKRVKRNQKKEIGHCPKVSKKIPIDIEKERDIKSLSKEDNFDTSSLDGFIGKEVEIGGDILIINKISLLKNQKVEVIAKNKSSKKLMKAQLKREDLESLMVVVNV